MIFNSVTYILFLLVVVPLYWMLPNGPRKWMLFAASLVFYGFWRFDFLVVMLFSAAVDYFCAIGLERLSVNQKTQRRLLLATTLVINLGLLFYFKYLYFFCESTNTVAELFGFSAMLPLYRVLLPFGISFYTFETISYTIDVYRGITKAEKSFINYALFVTFFPKLVAGPIQRANELIGQLRVRREFQLEFLNIGIRRILYGLFVKVVLADNLAPIVDTGFATDVSLLSAIDVLTLAFLFGFQIYFDFSGYSHIALGTAKLMGIDIPENFNFPYVATSFRDFWKRWHISLSAWIRDYLYLPLCGIEVKAASGREGIGHSIDQGPTKVRRNVALFVTWAIMGLWHGANWTFLVWGLYHATLIFVERFFASKRKTPVPMFQTMIAHFVTLGLVMLSWIPFRAASVHQTFSMWGKLFNAYQYRSLGLHENSYIIAACVLIGFYAFYFLSLTPKHLEYRRPWAMAISEIGALTCCIILVFTFLRPISQFIYFQF